MLAKRMRRQCEDKTGTAIAELRLQMLAQPRGNLIVGSERIADVRNPQRRRRGAAMLRRDGFAKSVEGVAPAIGRTGIDARIVEHSRRDARRNLGIGSAGEQRDQGEVNREGCDSAGHDGCRCQNGTRGRSL